MEYSKIFESSVQGVIDYLKGAGLKSMVLGISGGIDSTVCAAIGKEVHKREPGIEFYGVSLPCSTNGKDEVDTALMVGTAFFEPGKFWEESLEPGFLCLKDLVHGDNTPLSLGNIKARLRMIYLRDLAAKTGGLLLSTGNMTEDLLGFFTIAGDVGDLSPISELWKHEVQELAAWIMEDTKNEAEKEAIQYSLSLTPTDGNGVQAGGDLAQIAPSLSSYKEVDEVLMSYMAYKKKPTEAMLFEFQKIADKYGEETTTRIVERHKKSEFKRLPSPVTVKLSGINRGEPSTEELLKHVSKA